MNENPVLNDFPNVAHHYLVAMPSLTDPQFGGAVVYVAEHTPKGAMGLIVNPPFRYEPGHAA